MATSGMPILACCACLRTVSTSQCSASVRGASMTFAPVMNLADHFDIASETSAPPNPMTPANTSNAPKLRPPPDCASMRSTPSSLIVMLRTNRTARLVIRNSTMRLNTYYPFWKVNEPLEDRPHLKFRGLTACYKRFELGGKRHPALFRARQLSHDLLLLQQAR